MVALIRWFLKSIKRERLVLSNYEKSHPHFLRYIAVDAVVSVAIILTGFHFFVSYTAFATDDLKDAGITVMSVDELINDVKAENENVYWLGPIPGDTYTDNDLQSGINFITYLPPHSDPNNINQRKLSVKTYRNLAVYKGVVHPLMGSNARKIVGTNGISIEFNEESPDREVVTFKDKPEIVVIRYPTWQPATILMKNAENLRLIK